MLKTLESDGLACKGFGVKLNAKKQAIRLFAVMFADFLAIWSWLDKRIVNLCNSSGHVDQK
jgi:hypothetical protein